MRISYEQNLKNVKNNEKIFNDYYLNKIIDISIKYHHFKGINIFIHSMLYLKTIDEYDTNLYVYNMIYSESIEILDIIYNLFRIWLPFEKYDLSRIRGIFLELLVFKYINESFEEKFIHKESKLIINDFKSYTWDYIVIQEKILLLIECKFSFESLKRKHINQMVGTIKKLELDYTKPYIILFDTKKKYPSKMNELQENASSSKFNNLMKKFNIITIENFDDGNPFFKEFQ